MFNAVLILLVLLSRNRAYRTSPITGLTAYRPTSVFVSTGRFQNLIIASWMIILGFGGYLILRSKKGRIAAFTTIGILAAAALMSTSRGVFMWCLGSTLVIMAAFVWGAPWKQEEVTRVIRSIQRIFLLGGFAIVTLAVIFPEQVNTRLAIYSETLSPYSTASELAVRTRDYPLRNFLAAFNTPRWMYGYEPELLRSAFSTLRESCTLQTPGLASRTAMVNWLLKWELSGCCSGSFLERQFPFPPGKL